MNYDLHTHSNCSDGSLSPVELISRAKAMNVDVISITDHDSVKAYDFLSDKDLEGIRLIHGIEISSHWQNRYIHIVGLNIDVQHDSIKSLIELHQQKRTIRAEKILVKLSKKLNRKISLDDINENNVEHSIGRPHIARYLAEQGLVKNSKDAFDKYLGAGKLCDIKTEWMDLASVTQTIKDSGGIAVIAHPLKYRFTRMKLLALIQDFKEAGGLAMELISGQQTTEQNRNLLKIMKSSDLYASCGSDFHTPGQSWAELGCAGVLREDTNPIWQLF